MSFMMCYSLKKSISKNIFGKDLNLCELRIFNKSLYYYTYGYSRI